MCLPIALPLLCNASATSHVGQIDWTKGPNGFPVGMEPWVGDADTIAKRVIKEWRALGHDPNLNEVCSIELTSEGVRFALEMRGDV